MNENRHAIAGVAVSAFLFIGTAVLVRLGWTAGVDRAVLLGFHNGSDAAHAIGPTWLPETVRDITSLGSTSVLATVLLICSGVVVISKHWRWLGFLVISLVGAEVLSLALKHVFHRARPALVANAPQVFTSSFPSSHAMMSLVTLMTVAALVARAGAPRRIVVFAYVVAGIITTAIGVSRLYLGVHWPSDVVGGWSAGSAWFLTMIAVSGPAVRDSRREITRRSSRTRLSHRQ